MEEFGCIYKHTNLIHEGWSYIGQTIYDINTRWKNGHGYDKCLVFKHAIDKYGWENFSHEIIENNIPISQLDEREAYWISYYHTYIGDPECRGYNMTACGNVGRGRICSQETKIKTSASLIGHNVSDYVIQRLKEANIGRKHSEETKRKISQHRNGDTKRKPLKCLETNMVFSSINEAAKYYNRNKHWIMNRINNPNHFIDDPHFIRVNEHD